MNVMRVSSSIHYAGILGYSPDVSILLHVFHAGAGLRFLSDPMRGLR